MNTSGLKFNEPASSQEINNMNVNCTNHESSNKITFRIVDKKNSFRSPHEGNEV